MSDEANKGGNQGGGYGGISPSEYQRAVRQAVARKERIAELERQLEAATKERDTHKASVETLTAERDEAKTKLENFPSELKEANKKLQGEIRSRDHRKAIDGIGEIELPDDKGKSRKVKLKGDVLDDLLQLTGYKPEEYEAEGGTPDVERIRGFFAEAVKSRPWAIETADGSARAPQPGPAGGRGNPAPRDSEQSAERTIDRQFRDSGREDNGRGSFRI